VDLDERCQKLDLTQDEFEHAIQVFTLLVRWRNKAIRDGVWIGSEHLKNERPSGTSVKERRVRNHLIPPSTLEPN
jgi:hypothetical protein